RSPSSMAPASTTSPVPPSAYRSRASPPHRRRSGRRGRRGRPADRVGPATGEARRPARTADSCLLPRGPSVIFYGCVTAVGGSLRACVGTMAEIDMRMFAKSAGANVTFAAGSIVFNKGDPGNCMYVVQSGVIEMVIGDTVVEVCGANEAIGFMSVI